MSRYMKAPNMKNSEAWESKAFSLAMMITITLPKATVRSLEISF